MNDRKDAVRAIDYSGDRKEYYKNALTYVGKNGVNIYGVLVYGEAKDLLEFISNERIRAIEIRGVLPSKYID